MEDCVVEYKLGPLVRVVGLLVDAAAVELVVLGVAVDVEEVVALVMVEVVVDAVVFVGLLPVCRDEALTLINWWMPLLDDVDSEEDDEEEEEEDATEDEEPV